MKDELKPPDLQKHQRPFAMDLSDFDSEALMRKACGLSAPQRLAAMSSMDSGPACRDDKAWLLSQM